MQVLAKQLGIEQISLRLASWMARPTEAASCVSKLLVEDPLIHMSDDLNNDNVSLQ